MHFSLPPPMAFTITDQHFRQALVVGTTEGTIGVRNSELMTFLLSVEDENKDSNEEQKWCSENMNELSFHRTSLAGKGVPAFVIDV